ncbi:MAG: cobyrinate a,c-diamide synthase, partial [Methanomassiliicoccales archaeon]
TTIATGIMALLSKKYKVQGFKVGPDYIDPSFHSVATGRPSRNLDSFLLDRKTILNVFGWTMRDADIAVIEGVRGLYDGLTSTGDTGSTAEIAKILGAPVILVVNARSLAKSAAAHVLGFKMLDQSIRIEGVILNQVSGERHRKKAIEAVEKLTHTPVIGAIERKKEQLPERHLGLVTMHEKEDPMKTIRFIAEMASEIDLDGLLEISEKAEPFEFPANCPFPTKEEKGVKIAVPFDRAFSFYYPENIESIEAAGGKVIKFKPAEGDAFPEADGYYIGGGYPEIYAEALSSNKDFMEGLRSAAEEGKLIYGECGGLITLCESITFGGKKWKMAGIFKCDSIVSLDRQGLAYVEAVGTRDNFMFPAKRVRGHEFHYSRISPIPTGPFAYSIERGVGIDGKNDGLIRQRVIGAYLHQHALSNKDWGLRFVEEAYASSRSMH